MMTTAVLFLAFFFYPVAPQMTCGPRPTARMLDHIPCDMSKESFCKVPGTSYPFSSVRRYIYENQGVMRRMYGDQRQSFVLRNEIDDLRDKYDSLNFYGPATHSFRRPGFGPRSMDDFDHAEDSPASSPPPPVTPDSHSIPSTISQTTSISFLPNTTSPLESAPESEAEESTTVEYGSKTTSEAPATTAAASPQTSFPSESSSTVVPPDAEKPDSDTKKGVNACPVTEEVVAPFWANNTRVCKSRVNQKSGCNLCPFLLLEFRAKHWLC